MENKQKFWSKKKQPSLFVVIKKLLLIELKSTQEKKNKITSKFIDIKNIKKLKTIERKKVSKDLKNII